MGYNSLDACVKDLEKHKKLIRIKEQVDSELEMAAIHLRVYQENGPALLFENIKNSNYRAVSNLFGSLDRSKFIFRDTLNTISDLIALKENPLLALKQPFKYASASLKAINALPKKSGSVGDFQEIKISDLPQIKCWPQDGGAFITLPQVFTEDLEKPGILNSNLGMYRIQLSGNDYVPNKEIGLHYQLHRGIGVHQTKANKKNQPLKVSIFVGGPPSHTFSAVMPLPEGMSELTFAGILGGKRFRYFRDDDYLISSDADFIITGELYPNENKPEGPFGDHLGYYSLTHDFPLMRVHKVYAKKQAIWPFTVVGRPPQEDTSFGALIHEITGSIIPKEIPGLHEVNAVDAAGVHPLLLAIGSERYTPYLENRKPQEILTIANHILGFGQMSLAKYLFITCKEDNPLVKTHDIEAYFQHLLERIDWTRDLHFHTNTTMDTLDYSGSGLNAGSKVVIAAAGEKKRNLSNTISEDFHLPEDFSKPRTLFPGILFISGPKYQDETTGVKEIEKLAAYLSDKKEVLNGFPLIIVSDESDFTSHSLNNFLWVTFTRSNPACDIYGVDSFTQHKHWGCRSSLIIDARIKPHHAPIMEKIPEIEKKVDALGTKGHSLYGII